MQPLAFLILGLAIGGLGGYAIATARAATPPPAPPAAPGRDDAVPKRPPIATKDPARPAPIVDADVPAEPAPARSATTPPATDPAPAAAATEAELSVTLIGPDVPALPASFDVYARRERVEGDATYISERRLDVRDGHATGRCEPGRQALVASLGSGFRRRIVASNEIDTVAGPSHHVLAIPKLHTATVRAEPGRLLTLMPADDDVVIDEAACDDQGQCRFEWLPAGEYTLSDQVGVMAIRLPAVGPITFVPRPLNAVRVDVTDANGKLAQAGFVDGDVIVGIAGRRFRSAQEFGAVLSTGQPAILLVARRGAERSITLHAGLIQTGDPGGAFRPIAH